MLRNSSRLSAFCTHNNCSESTVNSESHEEPLPSNYSRYSSSLCNCPVKLVAKRSIFDVWQGFWHVSRSWKQLQSSFDRYFPPKILPLFKAVANHHFVCQGTLLDIPYLPVISLFRHAEHYEDPVKSQQTRMVQHCEVQLKLQVVDRYNSISILGFLLTLQMSCDTKETNECAAMWLSHIFMKAARACINARTCLSRLKRTHHEWKFMSYCKAFNEILETYAPDDMIAGAYMDT